MNQAHMAYCNDSVCEGECVAKYDHTHPAGRGFGTVELRLELNKDVGVNPKQAYGDKKVPLHLVPPAALIYLGLAMKEGGRKYGPYNWRSTKVESMTYIGAALRHILQMLDGEDIDPETGDAAIPHAALAMACLAIYADAKEGGFMVDNRPPKGPASKLLMEYKK